MSNFDPTPEQQAALDAFATGGNMVIEAGAGTGKTSTLRLLAESTDRTGIYIAYNKAIATDASSSFPSNVQCRTAHSLAFREVGVKYKHRLNGPRVTSRETVAILGIPVGGFDLNDEQSFPAWIIARLAMDTVGRFCNSADTEITERHVPRTPGVEEHHVLASYVLPFARKAWEDILSTDGRLRFQHDHYLKIWALGNPKLKCDFVLLDEAQDANPVIAGIVENQDHAQKIMVGDRCQAIYGWRGAVDAMSNFACDHRLILSKSFRFGPAIAEQANIWLGLLDAPLRLEGFDAISSVVDTLTDPDAILCRTNASVIENAMQAQAVGKRVAIVGGTGEIQKFTEAARDLMQGQTSSHPDLIAFKNWDEVVEYANGDEGADLRVMVKLIVNYGVDAILEVCANSVDERSADLIVSTAHKSKGREWDRVLVSNDFAMSQNDDGEISPTEMMLIYVTVTRAKLVLDNSALGLPVTA